MTASDRALRADARRNRNAVVDAAGELFSQHGDAVQMDDIAERAGVGVGTVYRHFADKKALRAAIIGRRFEAVTTVAAAAEQRDDPWDAFESLLLGYLEAAHADAAFRIAILGPEEPNWAEIESEKDRFAAIVRRIVQRAVDAGALRSDFTFDDFVLVSRGAIANMTGPDDWRRYLALQLEGVRVSRPARRPEA